MPRSFIRVGGLVEITGKTPGGAGEDIRTRPVEVIHTIRAEDTLYNSFLSYLNSKILVLVGFLFTRFCVSLILN